MAATKIKAYVGEINEDLIVRTTLDIKLQKIAEDSLNEVIYQYPSADQSALLLNLDGVKL